MATTLHISGASSACHLLADFGGGIAFCGRCKKFTHQLYALPGAVYADHMQAMLSGVASTSAPQTDDSLPHMRAGLRAGAAAEQRAAVHWRGVWHAGVVRMRACECIAATRCSDQVACVQTASARHCSCAANEAHVLLVSLTLLQLTVASCS